MQLRRCPSINWPPEWVRIDGEGSPKLTGEIGILRSVVRSRLGQTTFYLTTDFQGCLYLGTLSFSDGSLYDQVFELLQQRSGDSIQQIGNTELGDTNLSGLSALPIDRDGTGQNSDE